MASHPSPIRWTYEEFARLPRSYRNRYEVIAGELYVTPAPGGLHQRIVTELTVALEIHNREHGLGRVIVGPIDVLFGEGDYLEPDLVFVRRERLGILRERGIEGAPDLVVEVASPSTAKRDRTLKRDRYIHFGVPEYWIVDAGAGEVLVHRLGADPDRPEVCRDVLRWRPWPSAPALQLSVPELLRGLEE
jgi:Uma2 family endonuclease